MTRPEDHERADRAEAVRAQDDQRAGVSRRALFPRLAAVAAALPLAAAAGAACGPLARPSTTEAPARLRFGVFTSAPDEKAFDEVVSGFNARFAARKITAEKEVVGPLGEMNAKLTTLVAGGTPPDVVYQSVRYVLSLFISKALVDLSRRMKADANTRAADFIKGGIEDQAWLGGQVGLPIDYAASLLAHNRTLIQKAGAPDPNELHRQGRWNWDSFVDVARRVARPPDVWGAEFWLWDGGWPQLLWTNGGDLVSDDRRTCLLDRAEAYEAIQFMADWAHRQRFAPAPGQMAAGQSFFTANLAISTLNVPRIAETREKSAAGGWEFDFVPMPTKKKLITTGFGGGVSLLAGSKVQDQAWQLISYLGTDEPQMVRARLTGRFPARLALEEKYFQLMQFSTTSPPKNGTSVVKELNRASRPLPYTPEWVKWRQIIQEEVFNPVLAGQATAKEATAKAAPLINAVLKAEQR